MKYQKILLHLTNKLCINTVRKSNAKESIGCMSENTGEIMVGTARRKKLDV
jgi:hypothetical protein